MFNAACSPSGAMNVPVLVAMLFVFLFVECRTTDIEGRITLTASIESTVGQRQDNDDRTVRCFLDGRTLFNRSQSNADVDGFHHLSNYEFKCLRQLALCSSHGWSLRFQLRLNSFLSVERERKSLLFSTGAHEPHGDGILIYLYQTKNDSYLEFGLKEFRNDQFAYYWHIEADLELNKSIEVVTNVEQRTTANGKHHQMTIFFDGRLYRETQLENYTEVFVFKYEHLYPKSVIVYGHQPGLAIFNEIIYYERLLSEDEIANSSFSCQRRTSSFNEIDVRLSFV
jgi:hypothetical protein